MGDGDCCYISLIVALSEILAFIRLTVDLDFSHPVERALILGRSAKMSEPKICINLQKKRNISVCLFAVFLHMIAFSLFSHI